jgi:hypothetical protein
MKRQRITFKHLIFVLLFCALFYILITKGNLLTQPVPRIKDTDLKESMKEEIIEEIGLTFKHPSEYTFREEVANNGEKIRSLGFYVEKGSTDNPTYQLYGLYQFDKEATTNDLEKAKIGMDASTLKETSIAGYNGIEGLTTGPKSHYTTIIVKDGKLFSVSTWPPTAENKAITEQIIESFDFK